MDNPSNPSSSSGIAPFCWAVVATNEKHERWLVEWYESEALAKAACSVIKAYPHETYAVEAMHLGSSLARLQEERSPVLKVEVCPKRDAGAHCDHLTGSARFAGRTTEELYTCCYCNRDRKVEVKPVPQPTGGVYVMAQHGPFAPPIHVY